VSFGLVYGIVELAFYFAYLFGEVALGLDDEPHVGVLLGFLQFVDFGVVGMS
jgi:hypothetical protein